MVEQGQVVRIGGACDLAAAAPVAADAVAGEGVLGALEVPGAEAFEPGEFAGSPAVGVGQTGGEVALRNPPSRPRPDRRRA